MENYIEIAVSRKNNFKDTVICFAASVLPMLVGTYLVIMLYAAAASGLLMLGIVACAVLYYVAYKVFCSFNVEWEYTLVGNELRFSKIINKTKRRELMAVNLSKIEIMAKPEDNEHNHPYKTAQAQKTVLTSQTGAVTYYFVATTEKGKKVCVVFEPDARMIDNFNTTLRGRFFE
jgi:hypothetical protein